MAALNERLQLNLGSIEHSLTDGTDIPPPTYDPPAKLDTSQQQQQQPGGAHRPSQENRGGPLSSHPITPVDGPASDHSDSLSLSRPFSHRATMSVHQSPSASAGQPQTATNDPNLSRSPSQPIAPGKQQRRPSFASRFLSLRGLSGMRSKSSLGHYGDSNTDLSKAGTSEDSARPETPSGGSTVNRKRKPSTPLDTSPNGNANGSTNGNGIPHLMRKRSQELLSSTKRRMSGMWSRSEAGRGAQDNEPRQSQQQSPSSPQQYQEYQNGTLQRSEEQRSQSSITSPLGSTSGFLPPIQPVTEQGQVNPGESVAVSNERFKSQVEKAIRRDPAPKLPKLEKIGTGIDGGHIGGYELFENIGR